MVEPDNASCACKFLVIKDNLRCARVEWMILLIQLCSIFLFPYICLVICEQCIYQF